MKLPSISLKKENCCTRTCPTGELQKVILIGNPNVGKSSLFNSLSESYAIVSNYPGTSVEIIRGKGRIEDREYEIVDTPGMYSLLPVSEEERVTRNVLLRENPFVYLHVIDAKNLRRMLPLTVQFIEAGLPLILVLNMMDEAEDRGIKIDPEILSRLLTIPVIPTVSSERKGIRELKKAIANFRPNLKEEKGEASPAGEYSLEIEEPLRKIETRIKGNYGFSNRTLALLLLQNDGQAFEWISEEKDAGIEAGTGVDTEANNGIEINTGVDSEANNGIEINTGVDSEANTEVNAKANINNDAASIKALVENVSKELDQPPQYLIALQRQEFVNRIVAQLFKPPHPEKSEPASENGGTGPDKKPEGQISFAEKVDSVLTHPILGIPVLLLVLYFGLYRFVGVFAAGTVVDYLENTLFGETINPWVATQFNSLIPYPVIQDLFVGEYGIFTQAVTYAVALILPIVGAFFLVFSIIEDTGYLPRLGMLIDTTFKKIGLSGRAVIPMVLGFGCSTMATMVTRTLETRRERLIANVLLALAIPCSAQLGIILSVLSGNPKSLLIWATVICLEFVLVGYLAARLLPGKEPSFFMELPPLRRPKLSNIAVKTYSRMYWYFLEVLPLFVLASFLIWIGRLTGLFGLALKILEYPSIWIGLPADTAIVFLFGFFRRDFGAAGLYDMYDAGILSGVQLVVAAITLTLFMPCIAQFMMTIKERGLKTALAISGFIFPSAYIVGFIVNEVLNFLGVVI